MCVFIYSLCRLYYGRSIASSKVSFPQSGSQCFPFTFHYPLLSLRSSSSCSRLLPCLLITSILPSIFPSITCSRRQFLCKKLPIQLAFLLFMVFRMFIFSLTLLNTFAASYLNTQGLNNSCLKSPASTLVDLNFQSRALRSFSLNQIRNLSLQAGNLHSSFSISS